MRPYPRASHHVVSLLLIILITLNSTVIAQKGTTQRKSETMQQGINTIEKTTKMISDAQLDLIGDMAIVLGEIAFDRYGGKAMGFVMKDGKEYAELINTTYKNYKIYKKLSSGDVKEIIEGAGKITAKALESGEQALKEGGIQMVGETTAKTIFKAEDIALKLIELGALSANIAYLELVKQKSMKKAAENLRAKQARAKELEKVQADAEVFTKQVQEMVKKQRELTNLHQQLQKKSGGEPIDSLSLALNAEFKDKPQRALNVARGHVILNPETGNADLGRIEKINPEFLAAIQRDYQIASNPATFASLRALNAALWNNKCPGGGYIPVFGSCAAPVTISPITEKIKKRCGLIFHWPGSNKAEITFSTGNSRASGWVSPGETLNKINFDDGPITLIIRIRFEKVDVYNRIFKVTIPQGEVINFTPPIGSVIINNPINPSLFWSPCWGIINEVGGDVGEPDYGYAKGDIGLTSVCCRDEVYDLPAGTHVLLAGGCNGSLENNVKKRIASPSKFVLQIKIGQTTNANIPWKEVFK